MQLTVTVLLVLSQSISALASAKRYEICAGVRLRFAGGSTFQNILMVCVCVSWSVVQFTSTNGCPKSAMINHSVHKPVKLNADNHSIKTCMTN